jgi:phosphate transport system substrate-binding protein
MKTKKIQIAAFLLVIMAIGYSFTSLSKITIKGSDTMVILSQQW